MPRIQADKKLGYYPQPTAMATQIADLFQFNTNARVGDFCAGMGEALVLLSEKVGSTSVLANELEQNKFLECQKIFRYVTEGDFFTLDASRGCVQVLIVNPPYGLDGQASGENKRREYQFVKQAIQKGWIQVGGYMILVLYTIHLNSNLFTLLAGNCESIDMWGWDPIVMDEYKHVALICKMGTPRRDKVEWSKEMHEQAKAGRFRSLTTQHEPDLYSLPDAVVPTDKLVFKQELVSDESILRSVQDAGADLLPAFQIWLQPTAQRKDQRPVWDTKINHALTLVEAGIMDNIFLPNADGSVALLRSVVAPFTSEPELKDTNKKGDSTFVVKSSMRSTLYLSYDDGEVKIIDAEFIAEFMRMYGNEILRQNRKHFPPLFNVALPEVEDKAKQQWLPRIRGYKVKGEHEFYGTQQMVANAALNFLVNHKRRGIYLALDPRVGKTPISCAMIGATMQARIAGEIGDYDARKGDVHIIQSPGNLLDKWKREIIGMIPSANVLTVSLTDADGDRHDILADVANFFDRAMWDPLGAINVLVINMNSVKFGEGAPEPVYSTRLTGFYTNPETGEKLHIYTTRDVVTGLEITTRNSRNVKAFAEGSTFKGSAPAHDMSKYGRGGEWKKIHYGQYALFTDVRRFRKPKQGNGRVLINGSEMISLTGEPILDPWIASHGTRYKMNPRAELHKLIKARYKNRVGYFFIDELHHSGTAGTDINASTVALGQLARKVVGLTGTISRGVSSNIYDLERIINPGELFQYYPLTTEGRRRWIGDMGFLEQTLKVNQEEAERGDFTGVLRQRRGERELPGTTPLLIKWILNHAMFVALRDLGAPLVDYRHVHEGLDQLEIQTDAQDDLQDLAEDDTVNKLLRFMYYKQWVNTPFQDMEVHGWEYVREDGKIISKEKVHLGVMKGIDPTITLPKEEALVEYIRERLAEGRGVCVYVNQTNERDYQERLMRLILEGVPAAKPFILRTAVEQVKREAYINNKTAHGFNVMICNPMLVQEGFDLIQFPCYWWHELTEKAILIIQASARGWGMPQTKDCEVMFPFYTGSIEEVILHKIAMKIKAHEVLKGDQVGLSGTMDSDGDVLKAILDSMDKETAASDLNAIFGEINAMIKSNGGNVQMKPVITELVPAQEVAAAPIIDDEPVAEVIVPEPKSEKPYCPRFAPPFRAPAYNYLRKTDKLPLPEDVDGINAEEIVIKVKLFGLEGSASLLVAAYNPETGELAGFKTYSGGFEPFSCHIDEIMQYRSPKPFQLPAERDLWFKPCSLADAFKYERNQAGLDWLAVYNIYPTGQQPVAEPITVEKEPIVVIPATIVAPCPEVKVIKKPLKDWNTFWTKDMITNNKNYYPIPDGKKFIMDGNREVVWIFGKTEHRRTSVLNGQPVAEVVFAA